MSELRTSCVFSLPSRLEIAQCAHMVRISKLLGRLVGGFAATALLGLIASHPSPSLAGKGVAKERAIADPGASLEWLIREPVTLFDLGILRLKEDMARVARQVHERGLTALPPVTGAYFDRRERKVIAYLTVRITYGMPDPQTCRTMFGQMTQALVGNGPVGNRQASWYLESVFTPAGERYGGRPKTMADDLLATVRFEVSILPPNPLQQSLKAQCSGRLDADLNDLDYTFS